MELNERQKRFVDYYIQTGNATEAAKKAGYAEASAYVHGAKLLRNAKIRAALKGRIDKADDKRFADTEEIISYLTAVMRGEPTDELLINVGRGKGYTTVEKHQVKVSSKDRLKAAEMLAKIHGMFITRQELEVRGSVPVVIHDDI